MANKPSRKPRAIRKAKGRSQFDKERIPIELKIKSMGSRGQINADMERLDPVRFSRDQQMKKLHAGEMSGGDILLAMHYRAATVQEISRRTNLSPEVITNILGEIYDETDKELLESPKRVRQEVGGMMLRWARKFDEKIMEGTAEPHEIKAAVMVCEKLAKLTGANAPEEHEIRTFNVTANVGTVESQNQPIEITAIDILKDRELRDQQMKEELSALTKGSSSRGAADAKGLASGVLPGGVPVANRRAISGARSHSDHDDESDEAGEP